MKMQMILALDQLEDVCEICCLDEALRVHPISKENVCNECYEGLENYYRNR